VISNRDSGIRLIEEKLAELVRIESDIRRCGVFGAGVLGPVHGASRALRFALKAARSHPDVVPAIQERTVKP